ncbi:MAG: toxin-antitoxin system TumE family protein [Candidatus Binatia bacterium]
MLPLLESILRTSSKVKSFHIIDSDPLDEENFLFKIRCELISGQTLQIRLRAVSGSIRYSYQEFSEIPLRRWDNAPHFPNLPNFPHHHHDSQGNILESTLTGDPTADLDRVLNTL